MYSDIPPVGFRMETKSPSHSPTSSPMGESRNTKRRRSASAWPAARLQQLSLPTSTSSVGQIPAKWKHPSNCQRQNEKRQIQLDLSVDAVTIDGKQMTFGRHDVAEQSQVAIIYKLELHRQRPAWGEMDSSWEMRRWRRSLLVQEDVSSQTFRHRLREEVQVWQLSPSGTWRIRHQWTKSLGQWGCIFAKP